ncbi:reverse transcriptase [Elysia marginata]|uniref:Reverse transcriptase n=1 Tax=Elysia marginata TaxID=1093978 RepID=A0AAV4FPB4_9GAST|nr:reverse transcriptase [Elysia marginata]
MKGTNIAQTIRQIGDVLQMAKIKGTSGYILALDFSKCFDRVSHDYIVYSLQKFGFGENFIKWIRILMSNGRSCINNGGWLTDFFDLEQGLRQGCPMSPLLYLVAAELLSLKIQQTPTIKGINIPKSTDSYKLLRYADDTTLFLKDQTDLREACAQIKVFSTFSGLILNQQKSQILPMTNNTIQLKENFGMKVTNRVKILGIHFCTGTAAFEVKENYENLAEKIDIQIKQWSGRNLSLLGKIQVV